jgi:hypothetical protein
VCITETDNWLGVVYMSYNPQQEDHEFDGSLGYIMTSCLRKKKKNEARCVWLTPVIPATQQAVIRRIVV